MIALVEGQFPPGGACRDDAQLIDLLIKSTLLKQRMRFRQAPLVPGHAGDPGKGAEPDLGLFQWPLKEQDAVNGKTRSLGQQVRVMRLLRRPDRVEFGFQMAALRIKIIGLVLAPHAHACWFAGIEPIGEELTQGAAGKCLVQRLASGGDLAVLGLVPAAIRLAVRLEPAPCVQVKYRPADFMRRQRPAQCAAAQIVGVRRRQHTGIVVRNRLVLPPARARWWIARQ